MCVCVSVWECGGGKKDKPDHIPWRDRLRLISNALYERELSALSDLPVSPLLCLHLSLLFIFIFFFPLTSTHPSSTIPCISFIWLSASFLRIYQDFTLNCFLFSFSLFLCLCTCWGHSWWNWNSCLTAKTGALTRDFLTEIKSFGLRLGDRVAILTQKDELIINKLGWTVISNKTEHLFVMMSTFFISGFLTQLPNSVCDTIPHLFFQWWSACRPTKSCCSFRN